MNPVFIRKVGANATAPVAGMTGHAIGIINVLSIFQSSRGFVENHSGLVNDHFPRKLSVFSCYRGQVKFLVILFKLGFSPSQYRIIDKINDSEADGKKKDVLQPWRHEIVQFR